MENVGNSIFWEVRNFCKLWNLSESTEKSWFCKVAEKLCISVNFSFPPYQKLDRMVKISTFWWYENDNFHFYKNIFQNECNMSYLKGSMFVWSWNMRWSLREVSLKETRRHFSRNLYSKVCILWNMNPFVFT